MFEHAALLPLQMFTGDFLMWGIAFLVIAFIAGLLGFRGIGGIAMEIAWIFVLVFIILAIIALVL